MTTGAHELSQLAAAGAARFMAGWATRLGVGDSFNAFSIGKDDRALNNGLLQTRRTLSFYRLNP
jgi:hypothetical protein